MPRPHLRAAVWKGGALHLLDQRVLPRRERIIICRKLDHVIDAIGTMAVRGAPLIGVTAAYGMILAVRESKHLADLRTRAEKLRKTRPTAVNLRWAVNRMMAALRPAYERRTAKQREAAAVFTARAIHREDEALCERIGRHGAKLVRRGGRVMTICNTGALATGGIGTAFAVFASARRKRPTVYALETRPRLQGARLTLYELRKAGLDSVLVCDSAAASLMQAGRIDLIVTGADRIAANGDTANKIGTYMLAVLAREHRVPFYVAAPYSTFDPSTRTGRQIPIEERPADEVLRPLGLPRSTPTVNPAFDVTPAKYIRGFITDRGILRPPFRGSIRNLLS